APSAEREYPPPRKRVRPAEGRPSLPAPAPASYGTVTAKSVVSRPTPPFQISKPAKTLVRYQLDCKHLVVPWQLRPTASLMKSPRLTVIDVICCGATYETTPLPLALLMPYQTFQVLPPTVAVVTCVPIG